MDELAQHNEVPGSAREVNGGVVQLEFAFLSGETCTRGDRAGVSRGHSTAGALAGRSELDGCVATPASGLSATNPTGGATEAEAGRKHGRAQSDLLEQILSRENMLKAWSRVKANKGAPGIDGMSIEVFPAFARQHWDRIRSALYAGSYCPAAVRRVMITVWSEPPPNRRGKLFQLIHDEEQEVLPGHRQLLPVLWDMGILPDVRGMPESPWWETQCPPTRDAAIQMVLEDRVVKPADRDRARLLIESRYNDLARWTSLGRSRSQACSNGASEQPHKPDTSK